MPCQGNQILTILIVLYELQVFEELKRNKELQNFVNYDVHAFYYAWYGTPAVDGLYYHWNHKYLPHWNPKVSAQYPTGQSHVPPDDIG